MDNQETAANWTHCDHAFSANLSKSEQHIDKQWPNRNNMKNDTKLRQITNSYFWETVF